MGLIRKLLSKLKKTEEAEELEIEQYDEVVSRDSIDLHDESQRTRYIESCLDQIRDAQTQIGQLTREYSTVTAYLTDIEELEALPDEEKAELYQVAERISGFEQERKIYEEGKQRMAETDFRRMERMAEEVSEGIKKLKETESYQDKIRQDLNRLSSERHAYQYRKHELQSAMANFRGMIVITGFAFVTCMILLLLMQFFLKMDIHIGYLLTAGATALAIFIIYLKYTDAARDKQKVERTINRLILLQNKVKIRYVNNTNLLEYLYVKYKVNSSDELVRYWEAYQTEKEERERIKNLYADLDFERSELMSILRRFQIRYPEIWIHQAQAIINKKEMVEIRHSLILRRQKLRRQVEYNEKMAESAQAEVRSLAEEFPVYAPEIFAMVSRYEEENGDS